MEPTRIPKPTPSELNISKWLFNFAQTAAVDALPFFVEPLTPYMGVMHFITLLLSIWICGAGSFGQVTALH